MFHLPHPFHEVSLSFGALTVDRSSLVELVEGLWVGERTVVYDHGLVGLAVRGTDVVEVDVVPGVPSEVVEAMLYGFVMRVLFLHSGMFCLHASLVRFADGTTVAVAGHSGAGKSTTVSYTAQRYGATVLVDDVLAITVTDGVVTAHPFLRPVHLLPDSAERVGVERRPGDEPHERLGKLVVDLAEASAPVTLDHLVVLELAAADAPDALVVGPVRGAGRLRRVVRHSNATGLASFETRSEPYLQWATGMASSTPMTEVVRRPGDDTLDDVAGHIAALSRSAARAAAQPAAQPADSA